MVILLFNNMDDQNQWAKQLKNIQSHQNFRKNVSFEERERILNEQYKIERELLKQSIEQKDREAGRKHLRKIFSLKAQYLLLGLEKENITDREQILIAIQEYTKNCERIAIRTLKAFNL